MPTLQIRNLPQDLYDHLQRSAKKSRRSLTQEAIIQMQRGLGITLMDEAVARKNEVIDRIRKRGPIAADPDLAVKWIREDRDDSSR